MVEVKPKDPQDWPKAHKYDTLDFTYDVATEDPVVAADSTTSPTSEANGRKKKTFTDGDGPPPDPVYNFLADSERDGTSEKPREGAGMRSKSGSGSFRRQTSSGNMAKGKRDSHNAPTTTVEFRKPLQFEIQPKKNLETNWRERDTPETPTSPPRGSVDVPQSPSNVIDDSAIAATYHYQKKPLPLSSPKKTQQPVDGVVDTRPPALRAVVGNTQPTVIRHKEAVPEQQHQLVVEQRGNIQVSMSRDGEIQSVKCE